MSKRQTSRTLRAPYQQQRGFSLLQLMITLAVLFILASLTVISVASARQRLTLTSSAQQVVRYLEKTRTDSVRRHAAPGAQSGVQVLNSTTYRVTMDFGNNGTIDASDTRDFTLPNGVTFNVAPTAPPAVSYDWRGRLAANNRITVQNSSGTVNIDLSGGGDITLNSTVALPTITSTPYPTPAGTPVSTPTPTPTPSPPPPSGVPECYMTVDVTDITIRKNSLTTGYVTVTQDQYGNPGTVTATYDTSQLRVSPSTATISSEGTMTFAITDVKNGSKSYTTTVVFDHPCGQKVVNITVTQ